MASALSLSDAKAHLNIDVATYDTELTAVISSAEAMLAQRVGSLQSVTRTDRIEGDCYTLVLRVTPVVSLTSVTGFTGGALTLGDLHVETRSGTVTYNTGACFVQPWYDVVYSAGRSTVPDDLLLADKELVRHLWTSQRGGASRPGQGGGTDQVAFAAQVGSLPTRVLELIAPHVQPGFA